MDYYIFVINVSQWLLFSTQKWTYTLSKYLMKSLQYAPENVPMVWDFGVFLLSILFNVEYARGPQAAK